MKRFQGKKIIVTGGCGFIGSHLVRQLLNEDAQSIVIIDSLRYGDTNNLPELKNPKVKLFQFTLGLEKSAEVESAFQGADFLFHLAAEKHNQSKDSPENVIIANIVGTNYLYELAVKNNLKKVVFTSSLYAYGKMNCENFNETDLAHPTTVYGVSKFSGEGLLWHHLKKSQTMGDVVRYFFVYGPRQFAGMGYKSVIIKNFERVQQGLPPVIFGDGQQTLDYIFVDDAVEATIQTMLSQTSGEVYNVGSGQGYSVNDLIQQMRQVSACNLNPEMGPADWTHGSRRVGNNGKIQKMMGWSPKVSLSEGLAKTWSWLQESK